MKKEGILIASYTYKRSESRIDKIEFYDMENGKFEQRTTNSRTGTTSYGICPLLQIKYEMESAKECEKFPDSDYKVLKELDIKYRQNEDSKVVEMIKKWAISTKEIVTKEEILNAIQEIEDKYKFHSEKLIEKDTIAKFIGKENETTEVVVDEPSMLGYTRVYLVDVGILLSEDDPDFNSYSTVYNKHYGYFDEGQFYSPTLTEAIDYVKTYVSSGVERTYGIVSNTTLDSDIVTEDLDEIDVEGEEYILDNVVFSVAKIDGELVENFLEKDDLLKEENGKEER